MSKWDDQPIQRWASEPEHPGVDAELGELFRALPDEGPMSAAALGAVGRRLNAGASRRAARRTRVLVLAAAVLCSATGAALARWGEPLLAAVLPPTASPSAAPSAARAPQRPVRNAAPPAAPVPLVTPPEAPASATPAVAARPGVAEPSSSRTAALAAEPPAESALARESAVLSRALTALRRDHDAATALRVLDEYQSQFPAGVMSFEASTARVDALLMLGRRASALQLLSGLPLERSARRAELQLLRAELNAERDCSRALADFDAVLAGAPAGGLAERALYGRAGCRLRLGQNAAARADLQSYAARFPNGRFAQQVAARLAEAP